MSDSNTTSSSTGVGFGSLLAVLFIGLKLAHVINWSWWWVLSPIWISVLLFLVIVVVVAVVAVVAVVCAVRK